MIETAKNIVLNIKYMIKMAGIMQLLHESPLMSYEHVAECCTGCMLVPKQSSEKHRSTHLHPYLEKNLRQKCHTTGDLLYGNAT